jgi:hypothetical protein
MAERRAGITMVGALLTALGCTLAHAAPVQTLALDEERDRLIDKITRGVDYDASVRRFAELLRQRDAVVATSQRAVEEQRADAETRRAWIDHYRKTADYEVGWRCTLSPDPAHPLPSTEGRFKPDWGKVVRKEAVRLAPKNALDEGEQVTLYEIAGVARRYVFRGERFDPWRKPFEANVGELVLVCNGGEDVDRQLPPQWGDHALRSGFAVRLARPPLIVDKAKYQPIHITGAAFFWAIKDVKWRWVGQNVLSNIEIGRSLGDNRWEISADNDKSWVLEVPAGVKNRDILVPGHYVWVILGEHRFDTALRKLVLVARDLEPTYIFEKAPPR